MQEMTAEEKAKLTDLKKCDFSEMSDYFKAQSEARKAMTKDEKLVSYFGNYIKTKSDFVKKKKNYYHFENLCWVPL